jgi:hypothetical protein
MPRLSHPARLILPALVSLALFIPAAGARAGFVDYDVTRARLAVQRAEYLLGDAQYAADVARDDFERADRRAADLAREIDRQQRDVDDATSRLNEADRSGKWLREEVDRCTERADARQKELGEANERLRAAREAVQKLVDAETDKFEAGGQFKALSAAVDEAGRALDAAEKASLDALAQTDEHRAAKTAVDALRTRVQFLTDQGDRTSPDELAAAKNDLTDAEARLRRVEDRHLSAEPDVKNAEMKVAQAESALRSAREDFEKRLDQRPEVADGRQAEAAAQANYDNALRAVRDAEARADDVAQQLRKQDDAVALERDRLTQANDQLNRLLGEVREADDFAAASHQRLQDALEAVECARRERDAASWALDRAGYAADAFYGWGVPATGCGWSVVHVGLVDCAPRPVYYDPFCYRPVWCRPLTAFPAPYWHAGFGWGTWWGHHPKPWFDDGRRPVVVKVTHVRVHNPVIIRQRETAREQAIRLASRNAGDEQRRQRQATVEARRKEVEQRQVRLAGFGAQAGTQGAAAIAERQAREDERRQRQARAGAAPGQVQIERNPQQFYNGGGPAQAQRKSAVRNGDGTVVVTPSGTAIDRDSGHRMRWQERRAAEQSDLEHRQQARREREQKRQAEVANRAPAAAGIAMPPVANAPRADGNRNGRDDEARQAKATERAADRQAQEQRRAERDAAQHARQQQEAQADQARRQQRQQEVAEQRQREQQQDAQREAREAARRQDEQNRRQAAEVQRQRDAENRGQRRGDDSARDAARQQAAAEDRARRDAMEQARSAQREAQRDAARQAEAQRAAQRDAQREAARSAERAQRQTESESRRSPSSDDRSSRGGGNDRFNDSSSGRGGRGR